MKRFLLAFLFIISDTLLSQAQTIISQKDSVNGYTMTMDNRIASLLNKQENNCKQNSYKQNPNNTNNNIVSTSKRTLSKTNICRQHPRLLGYKIQIAMVKSKSDADKITLDFRKKFPYIKVLQDGSMRPYYRVLAGSYFTPKDTEKDLKNIKRSFGSAVAIKYMIFCVEAL
ncbi:SPOR domain-containing protein [Riemerella columbipharyngis]|uniref:Sporulation related domain-containing protein n=1 Tax=Riemerella columbipharyngis TaxID=1071918 RepID=A0A1G7A5S0_9FLAO|nr:SPOR domain-containing protein [Riemerella columbipharyngis]SDE10278.1 Sporulation related domain-containing protein [Riemerella columbipharyngis]